MKILKELGYIDASGVLARGKIASQIYGYEIQVTQLLFKGFFEKLSADELNVLAMAIVCEDRKDWDTIENSKIKNLKDYCEQQIKKLSQLGY